MENAVLYVGAIATIASIVWFIKRRTLYAGVAIGTCLMSTLIFGTGYRGAYLAQQASECRSNLEAIEAKLNNSGQLNGRYPESLREVMPFTVCPCGERDSYTPSYQCEEPFNQFVLRCGNEHPDYVRPLEIKGTLTTDAPPPQK